MNQTKTGSDIQNQNLNYIGRIRIEPDSWCHLGVDLEPEVKVLHTSKEPTNNLL
jgi:hypothetical protein